MAKKKAQTIHNKADIGWILLIVVFGISLTVILNLRKDKPPVVDSNIIRSGGDEMIAFESTEDFENYMKRAGEQDFGGGFAVISEPAAMRGEDAFFADEATTNAAPGGFGGGGSAERVSETNVQVAGIDEPDIVKTDGENIFVSREGYYYYGIPEPAIEPFIEVDALSIRPGQPQSASTKIIDAFPVDDLEEVGQIDTNGQLLVHDKTLLVQNYSFLAAYDVSNRENPEQSWKLDLDQNTYIHDTRLYDDKLYVVTRTYVYDSPCPFVAGTLNNREITVPCDTIFHPRTPIAADSTFNVMKIDVETGEMDDSISFIGSASNSIVYMSTDNLYVTYRQAPQWFDFMRNFVKTKGAGLVPQSIIDRFEQLASYDISQGAKLSEAEASIRKWLGGLNEDEALTINTELQNRLSDYLASERRNISGTGIVKVSIDNLNIEESGKVPGSPLNQFSLDEYDGYLRIATTVDERFYYFGGTGNFDTNESVNDVYVLDKNMDVVGAITDLGITERIYSARFIGDKGYLVTFRQIDPFYVLDLSNPKNPQVSGELKIPGYSSYLHPLADNLILGVGKEDQYVKVSLFDVSNPKNPVEVDKYSLEEYWTDVLNTHHAFLQDDKFNIFFLPGSKGGYIFNYADDSISLAKAISAPSIQRALFLDDYLYLVGQNGIVVLDESTWERVNELEFEN